MEHAKKCPKDERAITAPLFVSCVTLSCLAFSRTKLRFDPLRASSDSFRSILLGSVLLCSVLFCSVPFGSARFHLVPLRFVLFRSSRFRPFRSFPFSSARLRSVSGSVQFSSITFDSGRFLSAPFGSVRFRSGPFIFVTYCSVQTRRSSFRLSACFAFYVVVLCASQWEIVSPERSCRTSPCSAAEPSARRGRRERGISSRLRHAGR